MCSRVGSQERWWQLLWIESKRLWIESKTSSSVRREGYTVTDIPIANPQLGDEEREAVLAVLDSGDLAAGDEVAAFEEEFAAFCGAEHAVATTNGTTALHTALVAAGIGEGDTVITTPFSFVATANVIRFVGAEPVFADIDPSTFTLDPDAVEERIRERDGDVDAIMPVHLYALPADMNRFQELGERYDATIIEDAAQGHGGEYYGESVGTLGDVACFSFYPTKNMTSGEGGMITTDDEEIATTAAQFINHGRGGGGYGYEHVDIGHNFRMTNIAAAIGRHQLQRLPEYVETRRENAARLTEHLSDTPITTPTEPEGRRHAYNHYTIRCGNRDAVREALDDRDIGTSIFYPTPIHQLAAYDGYNVSMPVAEALADQVLSLPTYPTLSQTDVDRIGETIQELEVESVADVAEVSHV
jgi:perosamine synthetase